MDELAEKIGYFLLRAQVTSEEVVRLDDGLGRTLAQEIRAISDWPPFDRAMMDGYALDYRAALKATPESPVEFEVVGVVPAGSVAQVPVEGGQAIKVLTGAAIPAGANAVAPFEEVEVRGDVVLIRKPLQPWQHVRRRGTVAVEGDLLIPAGTVVSPREVEVAASVGLASIRVSQEPVVSIIPVGSELVEPGSPLKEGKIYASNGYLLAAWTRVWGGHPKRMAQVRDELPAILAAVQKGLAEGAVVVTTGGASYGDYDLATRVLEALGCMELVRIAPKTAGGPFAGGFIGSKPVLCFSGSPKAALRSAKLFLKPLLAKMLGRSVNE
ncbi:MAG: molybdopterin molybdotransferase MoeA [Firmicutes bacterium]|nr:molybdopterin molybdotransferase MoeA [Bacillota bacterium]